MGYDVNIKRPRGCQESLQKSYLLYCSLESCHPRKKNEAARGTFKEVIKNKQGISSVVGSLSDEEQVYGDVSDMDELMGLSQETLDTANEAVNLTIDLDASLPRGSELEKLVKVIIY